MARRNMGATACTTAVCFCIVVNATKDARHAVSRTEIMLPLRTGVTGTRGGMRLEMVGRAAAVHLAQLPSLPPRYYYHPLLCLCATYLYSAHLRRFRSSFVPCGLGPNLARSC